MKKYVEAMNEIKVSTKLKEKILNNLGKNNQNTLCFFSNYKFVIVMLVCIFFVFGMFFIPFFDDNGFKINVYAEDGKEIDVKLNTKFLLKNYSPVMSNVPGFPIKIVHDNADYIRVNASEGELCLWISSNGEVISKGKKVSIESDNTIYWSPLDYKGNNITLKIEAYKNKKIIETNYIKLEKSDILFYTGTLY